MGQILGEDTKSTVGWRKQKNSETERKDFE